MNRMPQVKGGGAIGAICGWDAAYNQEVGGWTQRPRARRCSVRTMWVHFSADRMAATKTRRVNLRVAPSDDDLLRRAAEAVGQSLSDFLVEGGRERAERVLADRTRFVLDDDAWDRFCAALDRPAQVKPAVAELFRRPAPE
jgi:uncharacterized protein (DUF1778 family)